MWDTDTGEQEQFRVLLHLGVTWGTLYKHQSMGSCVTQILTLLILVLRELITTGLSHEAGWLDGKQCVICENGGGDKYVQWSE